MRLSYNVRSKSSFFDNPYKPLQHPADAVSLEQTDSSPFLHGTELIKSLQVVPLSGHERQNSGMYIRLLFAERLSGTQRSGTQDKHYDMMTALMAPSWTVSVFTPVPAE